MHAFAFICYLLYDNQINVCKNPVFFWCSYGHEQLIHIVQCAEQYRLTKQGVNTMKHKISSTILLMVPLLLFGQMINNFDAEPEADYE